MLAEKAVVVVSWNASLQRALQWVLLVTVPRTVLDATASVLTRSANDAGASTDCVGQAERRALRTASVRQDQRKYCVLASPSRSERWYIWNKSYRNFV